MALIFIHDSFDGDLIEILYIEVGDNLDII